jgi:type I restriction enzyme, R subunit
VIFTTIQKFSPEKGEAYPMLTDRRNVVVIADEAHRSQYGFKARIEKTGEIAYGFAKHLRDVLPNASFHRLHRHPDRAGRREHARRVRQLHRHLRHQPRRGGWRDGADLLRESPRPVRTARRREAPGWCRDRALTEDEAESEQERIKRKWSKVEALVGAEKRLRMVAEDLVQHFEARVQRWTART